MVLQFDNSPLDSNALDGHRFKEIYQSSVNQLRQIMRTYHERFANDHPSVLWHTACLFIANDAIRSQSSDQQRRYLLSCSLEGYYSFYPRYPVTLPIVKGLLTMAISSKLLTSQEGIEAIRRLRAKGNEHDQLPEPTVACFMVDLDLALTDQKGAHIDSLAQRFDEMVLFDEFTNDRIDEEGGVTIN
jgi:hypothetical protein